MAVLCGGCFKFAGYWTCWFGCHSPTERARFTLPAVLVFFSQKRVDCPLKWSSSLRVLFTRGGRKGEGNLQTNSCKLFGMHVTLLINLLSYFPTLTDRHDLWQKEQEEMSFFWRVQLETVWAHSFRWSFSTSQGATWGGFASDAFWTLPRWDVCLLANYEEAPG